MFTGSRIKYLDQEKKLELERAEKYRLKEQAQEWKRIIGTVMFNDFEAYMLLFANFCFIFNIILFA